MFEPRYLQSCRVCPSRVWVESQIPEFVKVGVSKVGDTESDSDDFDLEALIQAYVNIVAGACISLGINSHHHLLLFWCIVVLQNALLISAANLY